MLALLSILVFLAALSVYIVLMAMESDRRRERGDAPDGGTGVSRGGSEEQRVPECCVDDPGRTETK